MTTYYVDPANGNDASDGLSWGTAWRTLLNGATFARLGQTDADEIRIAKSPDPVSIGSVTWTDQSRTLTIAALSNIAIDDGKTGWTQTAGTLTYQATYLKTTGNALQIAMSGVNGKSAHKNLGTSLNLSAMTRLSFWINLGTAANYTSSCPLQIDLCSDTTGNTPVVRCTLPRYFYPANYWVPITVEADSGYDFVNATAIQSITIRTSASVTNTIRFDNFFCAKASSDATSLVLTDMIAKDDGKGMYFTLSSIVGTSVDITAVASRQAAQPLADTTTYYQNLFGTETINTLKRWGFNTAIDVPATTAAGAVGALNYTNADQFPLTKTYIGGVNTSTNLVDGETWFDGVTGYGNGLQQQNSSNAAYDVSNIGTVRYYNGLLLNWASNTTWTNCSIVNPDDRWANIVMNGTQMDSKSYKKFDIGIKWLLLGFGGNVATTQLNSEFYPLQGSIPKITFGNVYNARASIASFVYSTVSNTAYPIRMDFVCTDTIFNNLSGANGMMRLAGIVCNLTVNNLYSTFAPGVTITVGAPSYTKINGIVKTKATTNSYTPFTVVPNKTTVYEFGPSAAYQTVGSLTWAVTTYGSLAGNNTTGDIPKLVVYNLPSNISVLPSAGSPTSQAYEFVSINHNGSGVDQIYWMQAPHVYWYKQTAVKYTGDSAWQVVYPTAWGTTNLNTTGRAPSTVRFGDIAVKAGKQVTVTMRCRRTATNVVGRFALSPAINYPTPANEIITSSETSSTDTWELITATFTPAQNGVYTVRGETVPITPVATAMDLYFDDLQVTQAD